MRENEITDVKDVVTYTELPTFNTHVNRNIRVKNALWDSNYLALSMQILSENM